MDYFEWFSVRLADLRIKKGVSARDMSLSLGQSESYINKIENKRSLPSMAGFFYICEYLDITPGEFFCVDDPSPSQTKEITAQMRKLSPEKLGHLLAIIKDMQQ